MNVMHQTSDGYMKGNKLETLSRSIINKLNSVYFSSMERYLLMIVDRLISVHFPKAAGTSLRTQLIAHLHDKVATDYAHDPLGERGRETADFPVGKRVVHGHFRPDRYAGSEGFRLTFLREPVDNLISIYYFWLNYDEHGNPVHTRFLAERPDIFEFARYPSFSTLMSQSYFGGFDMTQFDFIGFHENRTTDLLKLGKILGIPLQSTVHENPGLPNTQRDEIKRSRDSLDLLRNILKKDVVFYDNLRDKYA